MAFKTKSVAAMAASAGLAAAAAAQSADEPIRLDVGHLNLDEVVTTSSPLARPIGQSIAAATVITGEELALRLDSSIGETLRQQPGVSSTNFGAGASRPIIRGLGSDRIRVLDDGIGTFDVGQTSPDHAVPVEPALAESIEVFRGPASLLYGSSAAGGVVSTDSGRIPSAIPENGYEGALRYSHSTVNNADEVAGGVNVALGQFVFHGEGFFRNADDYDIPGLNASNELIAALEAAQGPFDPQEDFTQGFVPNSDLETFGGAGGVSYVFDNNGVSGFFGGSVSYFDSNYGLPAGILTEEDLEGEEEEGEGGEGEEEEGEEEGIRIDLEQIRYDLKGEVAGDFGFLQAAKFRFGYGDYEHVEQEGDEVGTLFLNDEVEARLELVGKDAQLAGGVLRSAFGTQIRNRDVLAEGAEGFVPESQQLQFGLFAVEEFSRGPWVLDLGARYEYVRNQTDELVLEEDGPLLEADNDFHVFSISGGAGVQATEQIFLGLNGFRTERAPSVEESFSFGPHLATQAFEIGDPTLDEEIARGVEGTIRGQFGPITAVLNAFYTNYDGFIFEEETGEILDGLPVFAFTAVDAEFRGFEAQVDYDFYTVPSTPLGPVALSAQAQLDFVRATASDLVDSDLPRIPPLSALLGFNATNDYVSFRAEAEYVDDQNDTASFELPTDSYLFFNLFLTVRPFGNQNIALDIRARNINDAEGRTHASFLKDTAPLPGRDVRFAIRAAF